MAGEWRLGQLGDPGLDVAVGDVGEHDPVPLRVDVLAHDPLVARSGGRLEVRLALEPPLSPRADGHPREHRVDVVADDLGVLHAGQEPLGVDLAGEALAALVSGRGAVVRAPGLPAVADPLLDAGHDSSCLSLRSVVAAPADWPSTYQSPSYANIFGIGIAFAPPHQISRPRTPRQAQSTTG